MINIEQYKENLMGRMLCQEDFIHLEDNPKKYYIIADIKQEKESSPYFWFNCYSLAEKHCTEFCFQPREIEKLLEKKSVRLINRSEVSLV